MTNSSKSLKVLPGPSSRFQGPFRHGPGPASYWVMDGCWDIILSHIPGMFLWCLGVIWDIPAVMFQGHYVIYWCVYHTCLIYIYFLIWKYIQMLSDIGHVIYGWDRFFNVNSTVMPVLQSD